MLAAAPPNGNVLEVVAVRLLPPVIEAAADIAKVVVVDLRGFVVFLSG